MRCERHKTLHEESCGLGARTQSESNRGWDGMWLEELQFVGSNENEVLLMRWLALTVRDLAPALRDVKVEGSRARCAIVTGKKKWGRDA